MFEVFKEYLLQHIELNEHDFALLETYAHPKKLRKRQYLLQEGDVCRYNCFITHGLMRMYAVDQKGEEHVIRFASENWWISDRESIISGLPSRFNIDAIEDTEVLLFDKASIDLLMHQIPSFGKLITDMLNKSFVTFQNRVHESISYNAEEKYTKFVERYPAFALRVPQAMIASYLGIKPETLSRLRSKR
ncbi:Crp/Fnr family transcriptional regulator [Mucilaginibacter sp. SMC90]|uniref:Crp/Fnr family transcriptional regulator n=1 Tax=Mucilaginibacter sp. SMC90 TaxID=2929803 RepID=UPI001FB21154|nr:Crp/Fnr family transcriptional regulator [Mucilaginibacter sp. SMC90]UOE50852.1 Crp/Fnr family transcriptional regulator [Mucilaginibacter sp. SMC90]